MNSIEILAPESIAEALLLLSTYGEKCRLIAGGTDLLARMKKGQVPARRIVNIVGLKDLDFIEQDEKDGLIIGALTTLDTIEKSLLVRSRLAVLSQSAGMLGSPAIRHQATIGGNLCNAAPSADMATVLMVLGARAKISSRAGERLVPIEDFFIGPGQTALKPDEMLLEIHVPGMPPHTAAVYLKQKRRQGADLAVVGAAALVTLAEGLLREVRIGLGAVAPTPIRARRAEALLRGKPLNDRLAEEAGQVASSEASPIDDLRGSAEYRRKLIKVLVSRAVQEAAAQARTGG